jgi:phage replication initiation protein
LVILADVLADGGKVTRLDLAIDAVREHVNERDIYEQAVAGYRSGTARKFNIVEGSDGGRTLYIGSRQSERFIRVYDKGCQMQTSSEWHRLECELKGDVAKQYAHVVSDGLSGNLGDVAWSIAKGMLDMDNKYWQVFGQGAKEIGLPKIEKQSDTLAWIKSQCLPAIERELKADPKGEIYELIRDMLASIEGIQVVR